MRTVNIENAGDIILEYINEYAAEVAEQIDDLADATAQQVLEDVVRESPSRTGGYKDGWQRRKEADGARVRHRILNVSKPQLTHLLEFGHVTRLGTGRSTIQDGQDEVAPRPHILPAYERHAPAFYEKVKQIVQRK